MDRRDEVLKAIVKHFIQTAEPVGSQTILVSYKFSVSPATIRNDMASLENEGMIFQPHTSSGRVPTDMGYRRYVNEMLDYNQARKEAQKALAKVTQRYEIDKIKEKMYDAVSLLARATKNASFATLPDNNRAFYLGFSDVLKQPEFADSSINASQVIEVFEKSDNFVTILNGLKIGHRARAFIGKENAIPQIQSCSIVVVEYNVDRTKGYLGLLGPTRMNYAFNMAMVDQIKELLEK
ncbi:MAG: DeoR family transcriptional regulator [Patescibacteria group bacterium]|nr:DeoR family transcriptional regulator [Patescibacteria group bacterium]